MSYHDCNQMQVLLSVTNLAGEICNRMRTFCILILRLKRGQINNNSRQIGTEMIKTATVKRAVIFANHFARFTSVWDVLDPILIQPNQVLVQLGIVLGGKNLIRDNYQNTSGVLDRISYSPGRAQLSGPQRSRVEWVVDGCYCQDPYEGRCEFCTPWALPYSLWQINFWPPPPPQVIWWILTWISTKSIFKIDKIPHFWSVIERILIRISQNESEIIEYLLIQTPSRSLEPSEK